MPGMCRRNSVIKPLLAASMLLLACSHGSAQQLYQELGAAAGLQRVVDDLMPRLQRNPHLRASFKDSNLKRLNQLLVEQFCELSGGPCRYSGDDMKTVHAGLAISELQFNALVEELQAAMTASGIASAVQNRLLARLAPMKYQILSKPGTDQVR